MGGLLAIGGLGLLFYLGVAGKKSRREAGAPPPPPGTEQAVADEFSRFAANHPDAVDELTACMNGACPIEMTRTWVTELTAGGYNHLALLMASTVGRLEREAGDELRNVGG